MEAAKAWARHLLGANFILPLVAGRRYIFLFHDVSEPDEPQHNSDASIGVWPYSYRPQDFVALIELLQNVFELVSLDAIVSERPGARKRNYATVAFDDGFLSVATRVLSILKEKGVPFSVFLNKQAVCDNRLASSTRVMLHRALSASDERTLDALYERLDPAVRPAFDVFQRSPLHYVDEDRVVDDSVFTERAGFTRARIYLDEQGVQDLAAHGVTVGNHTVSHPMLSACDEATLRREIGDNKRYLSELVGTDITHFAIPFGGQTTFTNRDVDVCRELGHPYVYSTNPANFRYADLGHSSGTIPRFCIYKPVPREFMFYINRPFLLPTNQ